MPEQTKGDQSTPRPPAEGPGETVVQPASAGGETPSGAAAGKPAPGAASPPAASKPAPAAPAKPVGPVPEPWVAALPDKMKSRYGSAIREAATYLGQDYLVVDRAVVTEVLQVLRGEEQFDYCVDITAVHYPKNELQFEVVWILYSFASNRRMRVKTRIKDGEAVPSAVDFWPTANWLERECYDMFGIAFEGHPDLRRILLPDGWTGYPLRKDYSILLQDKAWVQANLGIESGQ